MPSPNKGEKEEAYMQRCMGSDKTNKDFPDQKQRYAFCASEWKSYSDWKSKSKDKYVEAVEEYSALGYTEEINEENFVIPAEADYVDFGEETEEWDISEAKPGLWENIRKKKEREGKNYRPSKKGDPDRPDPEAWKKAQQKKKSKSHDAGSMEKYVFQSKEEAMKMAKKIGMKDIHPHKTGDDKTVYMPGKNMKEFSDWYEKHSPKNSKAAEYQGRKVSLNKPFRTPDGPKKFSVYVKNQKGNVVKVNFGDPNMEIKKDNPARRRSFRARHRCDTPGPKWKARYWSCKKW